MPIQKKKPMSFGKLVAIGGGGLAFVMVLTYAVIQGVYGEKSKSTAQKQPVVTQQQSQQVPVGPQSAELERANAETREAIIALHANMKTLYEQSSIAGETLRAEIDQLKLKISDMEKRLASGANTAKPRVEVEVIKPTSSKASNQEPLITEYMGRSVTAVVGDTIWVKPIGGGEAFPVRFGQPLNK